MDSGVDATAGSVQVAATAVDTVTAEVASTGVSGIGASGSSASATDTTTVEAYVGPAVGVAGSVANPTTVTTSLPAGVSITANLTSNVTATTSALSMSLVANGGVTLTKANANPIVRAFVGDKAIVETGTGVITVAGHDIISAPQRARAMIGLVPQELTTDAFETVWSTTTFSRGLWGKRKDPAHITQVLRSLSLWDKKDSMLRTLSGGMKRRVMIAKALSHEPKVLFLDEPTAGVDVELRKDMWEVVRGLRASGVTIILTTHYIEEAEEMADRIGIISKGELMLVEEKAELMRKLGRKQLTLQLQKKLEAIPASLAAHGLTLANAGSELVYTYDTRGERTGITTLLGDLAAAGIRFRDLATSQSSLEDIFVELVRGAR